MIKFDFQDKFVPEPEFREAIKISQNFCEFEEYAEWISARINSGEWIKPIKYLELGSYAGESLYYMAQILPRGSTITLVDLPTNEAARKVLVERVAPWCIKTYKHDIKLISGDTLNPAAAEQASKYAHRYDLCFIDANHEFAYTLNDFVRYRDKASWISFHDISRFNTEKTKVKHGVVQANANHVWEAIKVMVPKFTEKLTGRFITTPQGEAELVDRTDNWLEFIAYDNEPMPTKWEGWTPDSLDKFEKPRGIGVLRSQW